MPREKSAGAIVFREREDGEPLYLLLHYEEGHWDFPKGHVEPGETELATVAREVEEETGLKDITVVHGFKETISYFFRRKEVPRPIYKEVVFYLAKTNTREVRLSFEHIGFDWLPFKKAHAQLTFQNAKQLLQKADEFLRQK